MFTALEPADRDRGSSPIQVAILFPVVILLIFAIVQAFLAAYAHNVAATAAREGVSAGRMYGAGPGDGAAKARAAVNTLGGDLLVDARVSTAGSTTDRIRITVQGRAISLLPGMGGWPVTAAASGPVERWTTAAGGR
ncbi:pilus assembly protein [Streptomyces sp. NBC_01077]|uniref:TadE/TadG family type IV pilus assembly protein n=1 Tax=Streptomyces sp. NBC_01077 TaxID=2903746 RepID=UPI003870738D|nr:pilus assembly protein [Streptomyces sp. NBC_01077]WSV43499.1 pilus assembly protein [Streptomyces sp. NBC_01077]